VGWIDEAIEPIFKAGIIDFLVVATLKVGEPGIDAPPQPVELERLLGAALLQRTDGIAHRLAGVAVFPGLQHLVDEGVLLGRQADIAGRHRTNLTDSPER